MEKLKKAIKKRYSLFKLTGNKHLTSLGLNVFTPRWKLKTVGMQKNIPYGLNKLQKFDLIVPKEKIDHCPVVFYIHGGAWCGGDKFGYNHFCSRVAEQGFIVVNMNYRLMPKVGAKTCVKDCINAIKYFEKNGTKLVEKLNENLKPDFNNCFLVGDSAGAHISSLITAKNTSHKLKLKINISALGLYYGVYTFENMKHEPSLILRDLDKYWKIAEPNTKKFYKDMSTTTYFTNNFPPCFLTAGEMDKIHSQSVYFTNLLKQNNIECEFLSFDKSRQDGRHAFLNVHTLKSSKEAFNGLINFFKKILARENKEK
ncbi:MAG: alpha/beta hydrolase fold domain-containing protein [Clostridia bacterium]|nr:alpha/beta hydrolase fold domain-containing protein [Clostridia bacterium]